MIELTIIIMLLVLNGIFAMAEIALVSAKKARLQQRAQQGSAGAFLALQLAENPERFLSTVQIGITLVGVLAGAFGGASLSEYVSPLLAQVPFLASHAQELAFALVVMCITYLSLVIGELVPKNLALRDPEAIASAMAGPMHWLSRMTYPLVWLLELSTRVILRFFGKAPVARGPTREEVMVLVREGMVAGELRREETDMLDGVFDLRELRAEEIMRPKPKVLFFHIQDTPELVAPQVALTRQSVFPVYDQSRDHVVGLVAVRDLFTSAVGGQSVPLNDLMKEPVFVPDNQPALTLIESLRKAPHFSALVTDEFGIVRGLVTLDDLVEEVVGDLTNSNVQVQSGSQIRETGKDAWLIDGLTEIDVVINVIPDLHDLVEAEKDSFQTLAGFIVHHLKRLPAEGEQFTVGNLSLEIVDMDRQRIDKVAIRRLRELTSASPEETPATTKAPSPATS